MAQRRSKVGCLSAAGLFALAVVLAASFLLFGPGSAPDARDYRDEVNALLKRERPIAQSVWGRYVPILREWKEEHAGEARVSRSLQFLLRGEWDDPRHAPNLLALERVRPVVLRVDALAAAPSAARLYGLAASDLDAPGETPAPEVMFDYMMPSLGAMRGIALANAAMLRASAAEGDWDGVVKRARTGLALARHASEGAVLIEWLVGVSILELTMSEVRHALKERAPPMEAIAAIEREVGAVDDSYDAIRLSVRTERLLALDALRAVHEGRMDAGGAGAASWLWRFAGFLRRRDVRLVHEHFDRMEAWWDAPYAEQRALMEAAENEDGPRWSAASVIIPSLMRASQHALAVRTSIGATRAMLRIEAFRAAHGRWPETLEEAAGAAGALDPVSGLPFGYGVLANDPDGRAYELRAPAGAWHIKPESRILNPLRTPLPEPDRSPYSIDEPDFPGSGGV